MVKNDLYEYGLKHGLSKLIMPLQAGGNRQDAHEKIRVMSQEAGARVKQHGEENDLLERIKNDKFFESVWDKLGEFLNS